MVKPRKDSKDKIIADLQRQVWQLYDLRSQDDEKHKQVLERYLNDSGLWEIVQERVVKLIKQMVKVE